MLCRVRRLVRPRLPHLVPSYVTKCDANNAELHHRQLLNVPWEVVARSCKVTFADCRNACEHDASAERSDGYSDSNIRATRARATEVLDYLARALVTAPASALSMVHF